MTPQRMAGLPAALTLSAVFWAGLWAGLSTADAQAQSAVPDATPGAALDTAPPAEDEVVKANCRPNAMKVRATASEDSFPEKKWKADKVTKTTIKVGGRKPSCVLVSMSFEAVASPDDGGGFRVRAVMGGSTIANPQYYYPQGYIPNTSVYRSYAVEFLFPKVDPGQHVVKIQVESFNGRTSEPDGKATIRNRLLKVQYSN